MIFRSKAELLRQLRPEQDNACPAAIEWLKTQPNLAEVLRCTPLSWRFWCLQRGYSQFAKNCSWNRLTPGEWLWLLEDHPQYAKHCCWEKLWPVHWVRLLRQHPAFVKHCPVDVLDATDWKKILRKQPQLRRWQRKLSTRVDTVRKVQHE